MGRTRTRSNRTRRARTNHVSKSHVFAWAGGLGVLVTAFILIGASMFSGVPLRDYGKLNVVVDDVGNISTHDEVRVAGVRVGQVLGTARRDDGRAVLDIQLQTGFVVPVDTKVRIRANGLLGARLVELVPGQSSELLADGATLTAGKDSLTFGVPEALDVLDERTREALGPLLAGLGQGTIGRGQGLNDTLVNVAREIPDELTLMRALNTAPEANRALVPALAAGMGALSANRDALGQLFEPTRATLAAVNAAGGAVERTLAEAPDALTTATVELKVGRQLLAAARSLSVAAEQTLDDAPRGLRAAVKLLDEAQAPLRRTDGLLRAADATVPPVLRVVKALAPVLGPLGEGMDALTPTIEMLGRHGCDIQNFATTWRSMTEYGGTGTGPAGPAMAFRLQIIPPGVRESVGIADVTSRKDPYPAPCRYGPSEYPRFVPRGAGR